MRNNRTDTDPKAASPWQESANRQSAIEALPVEHVDTIVLPRAPEHSRIRGAFPRRESHSLYVSRLKKRVGKSTEPQASRKADSFEDQPTSKP
jgi:hypothetical protein